MKKKILATLLLASSILIGCGNNGNVIHPVDEFLKMDTEFKQSGSYTIGILKQDTIPALEASEQGFIARLNELGWEQGKNITFNIQNAVGDASNLSRYADSLISSCDLVLGIATGSSQHLKSAQLNAGTKKPILFTAVTDPTDAKLVNSNDVPGGYVTGTSDAQPVAEQIKLIKECIPTAKKVGVIYTITEQNSRVQALAAAEAIRAAAMTPEVASCNDKNDISAAVNSLVSKGIEALYIPTDNNIASHLSDASTICNNNHILVCTGEEGMVTSGGHVSLSIDYNILGQRTADIANEILCGRKSPNQIKVTSMSLSELVYVKSDTHLAQASITLPTEVLQKSWKNI